MKIKRIVLKLGTEVLFPSGSFDQMIFLTIASQVRKIMKMGTEVIIVSSGAIKSGKESRRQKGKSIDTISNSLLASVGTRHLLNMYGDAFGPMQDVAPVLVTYSNWKNKSERNKIRSEIVSAFAYDIVPIINENDIISDKEIKSMNKGFSENDRLARMIAELVDADAILFLTNCGGVFEANPKLIPNARLFKEIDEETAKLIAFASYTKSSNGSGGMAAKLSEAVICSQKGMRTAIAGLEKNSILRFAKGKPVGTLFGKNLSFWRRIHQNKRLLI